MNYSNNEYIKSPAKFLTDWGIDFADKNKQLQTICLFSGCDDGKTDPKLGHLYFLASTGQYHCKKCNAQGNLVTLAEHLGLDVSTLYLKKGKLKKRKKKEKTKQENLKKVYEDNLINEARTWHEELTSEHKQYFIDRGLSEEIIEKYMLGEAEVDGLQWLTIPVFDEIGKVIYFKLRRLPEHGETNPTKYRYTKNAEATLYGIELLKDVLNEPVYITEGELDALVLRDWGFTAISSTGGAGTFKNKWVNYFDKVSAIFFCFDNDDVGQREVINHAKKFKNRNVFIIDIPKLNYC